MSLVTTTVMAAVCSDQRAVFGLTVPIDLTTIFTGYGMLPAVISTKRQTGEWDAIGQTRIVCLSDGSTAREQLTHYDYAQSFGYRVSEFTGAMRYLAHTAEGSWWFDEAPLGQTTIRWQYGFQPSSRWVTPLLWVFTHTLWRGYMRHALFRLIAQLQPASLLQATPSL